jgi:hypothetical protein
MNRSFGTLLLVLAALVGTLLLASTAGMAEDGPTVTRTDGGSIQTVLSAGIVVNEKSSLRREWIAVHDPEFPADLKGTPGVTTAYVRERRGGEYAYQAEWNLTAHEPLAAVQVKFICFDIWGERTKALVSSKIEDIPAGTRKYSASWSLYSEHECAEHYASIAYVARVRTQSGKVFEADVRPIVEEAKRFSAKFTEADLEPAPPKGE